MRINGRFFYCVLLFLASSQWGLAQAPIAVQANAKLIIHTQFEYLEDENGLTLQEVKSLYPDKFVANTKNEIKNTAATYWLRFQLSNYSKNKISRILNFNDPDIQYLVLYEGDRIRKAGAGLAFAQREIAHKNFCFELNFKEYETKTIYVAVRSNRQAFFTADISPISTFISYSLTEYFVLGSFYGIIFILCIYNLILYFTDRNKTYIYYIFYLISCAFFALNEDGLGFQFVWSRSVIVNEWLAYLSPLFLLSSFLVYASNFLQARKYSPQRVKQIGLLFLVFTGYYIFHFANDWQHPYWFLGFMLPFSAMYWLGVKYYKNQQSVSRYFIAGTTTIFVSFVVYFLRLLNVIPSGILPVYSFNFAFVIEAIALSMAVGAQVKSTIHQKQIAQAAVIAGLEENERLKDKVNRELEDLVAQRTKALSEKSEQLAKSNEQLLDLQQQLYKMNEQLDLKNYKLEKEAVSFSKDRLTGKIVSYDEFLKIFSSVPACNAFIADAKWANGFTCKKCAAITWKAKDEWNRVCTSCGSPQSLTAGTLFHSIKFPLSKALYIAYITLEDPNRYTMDALSEHLEINRNTCWSFRKKALERIDLRKAELKKERLILEEIV